MDASDLKAAIRVAQSACRSAQKEATFGNHALSENESEKAYCALAEFQILDALAHLDAALREAEKSEDENAEA